MNGEILNEAILRFKNHFGGEPAHVAYAPGRVEVIGNHTDYNDGFVLSAAINYGTFFAISPSDGTGCRLVAGDLMREVRFDVLDPKPSVEDSWSNYCKGVLAALLPHGDFTHGFNALFFGNIPQGAGLSSSAALEVATGLAIGALYGLEISKIEMAKAGQWAEHAFAGVKCGLLDQISSIFGRENMLVKTDFRSLEIGNVPMGNDAMILVCKSGAKHALVDGTYNERRADCEAAASFFASRLDHPVKALRDVSWDEWESLRDGMEERTAKRAAHPIGENERVLEGALLLEKGDLAAFGALMYASHDSSVRYFENSCEELDFIVGAAKAAPGVLGARLSGGGFGGSVAVLVLKGQAEAAAKAISDRYEAQYGAPCEVLFVSPSEGASVVK